MLLSFCGKAQNNPYWQEPARMQVDSLKNVLATSTNDTVKMYISRQLGMYNQEINRTAALTYYEEMLKLAKKTKQRIWEAEALRSRKWLCVLFDSKLFRRTKISVDGQRTGITKKAWKRTCGIPVCFPKRILLTMYG